MNEPQNPQGDPEVPDDGRPQADPDSPTPGSTSEAVQIADAPGADVPGEGDKPYGNMWVPLLIVPGAIVMVVVIIFALFGSLAGGESTVAENLHTAVQGGKNERQQARFNLIRQLCENIDAQAAEREVPYVVPEDFADLLEVASQELDDDAEGRLVIALALSWFEPSRGAQQLVELLSTAPEDDPENRVRINALLSLGNLALMRVPEALPAEAFALQLIRDEDIGLRYSAAGALQGFGGSDAARAALIGALDDPDLTVRATAAYALAAIEPPDPAAIPLLVDMTGDDIWLADRNEHPDRWRDADNRMDQRIQAVNALARYGETSRATLEALDHGEQDLKILDAVRRALAD